MAVMIDLIIMLGLALFSFAMYRVIARSFSSERAPALQKIRLLLLLHHM